MKAIFFDIDGTLVENKDPKFPTPKVAAAIGQLKAAGHMVFIASGRSITYLNPKIKKLGFDGYVLLNGATIFLKDKLIIKHLMDSRPMIKLLDFYEKQGIEYAILGPTQTYVKKDFNLFKARLASYDIYEDGYTSDFDIRKIQMCKIDLSSTNPEHHDLIINNLPKDLTYVADPFNKECAIDIFPKAYNKATGILELLKYLQIPVENSYAFGDGDNDLEMLSAVGHGFAMGNGTDRAKAVAKTVVPSVFDDGVAYGIENYILK